MDLQGALGRPLLGLFSGLVLAAADAVPGWVSLVGVIVMGYGLGSFLGGLADAIVGPPSESQKWRDVGGVAGGGAGVYVAAVLALVELL